MPKAAAHPGRARARPASPPALDIRSLPGPETILRQALNNGIVVLARENFASPSVVVTGYLLTGSIDDPRPQAGLADLTASALMRGTERWPFREIYERIESVGATLGIGAGKHTTTFQGKALAEDLGLLLDTLHQALLRPTFPADEVRRLRGEKLTGLAIRDQDTGARAGMAFEEALYPGHPYSIPDDGYRETVQGLTPARLKAFHHAKYGPQGMVITVVGAVRARSALEAVASRFGDWPAGPARRRPGIPAVEAPGSLVRAEVTLAGKSQCDLVLGAPGPARSDPGYLAAAVGNSILGRFGLFGRIGDAVRESAGLAYYAYSAIGAGPGPEPWEVVAGVNPENVDRAIDLIRREIGKFIVRRVTAEELADNQANFIGRLPLQLESNEGVAGALTHMERFGLGLDYYQRFPASIRSLTREQILETAKRFLHPDHLVIAVAGPVGGETKP
jgi:zinc protease